MQLKHMDSAVNITAFSKAPPCLVSRTRWTETRGHGLLYHDRNMHKDIPVVRSQGSTCYFFNKLKALGVGGKEREQRH